MTVRGDAAAPHHLVADAALSGGPYAVRRTRAGDAWERRQERRAPADRAPGDPASAGAAPADPAPAGAGAPVSLGWPGRR